MNSLYNYLPSLQPVKRKVFLSYHHRNDQSWYNSFSTYFSSQLGLFHDNSLERAESSENATYLNRKIREEFIYGTSITIVLCGTETYKRRWVDWEIHATLEYEHALLGIVLPHPYRSYNYNNEIMVPQRLLDNLNSGYAKWMHWTGDYSTLLQGIETAILSSKNKNLIMNSSPKMQRSMS